MVLFAAYTQMYRKLKLVIIGCHGAGKNDVGNTILGKNIFTWWTKWNKTIVKGKCKTPEGKVTVYRAPGWSENEGLNENLQYQIKTCLRNAAPHALILVIKVTSSFTGIRGQILDNIFDSPDKFWAHTIVLFTCGERLGNGLIEDYIRTSRLDKFIPRSHTWRYIINSDEVGHHRSKMIEVFEDMITEKYSLHFPIESDGGPEEYIAWFKERISQLEKAILTKRKQVESQKKTIKKLKKRLKQKEEELKKKSSACLRCPALQQQIEDLQQQNKHLQQENKILLQALSNQQRESQTKRRDHASNKRGFTQHFKEWMTPHASKTSPIKDIEMSKLD